MKKLSLLVALILLVTVGGVYATWNYAQGDVTAMQGFVLPKMESVVTTGAKGSFTVDTSGMTIKVDDLDTDSVVHKPVLVIDGKITITFNPAVGADETVTTTGVPMKAVITCTDNWKYEDTQIITVDTANQANEFATTGAALTFDITADQLKDIVSIANFTLPTYSDFQDFQTILNRGNIKISVSEVE